MDDSRMVVAEVFATTGSPRKRDHLRSLGVPHVFDSRTLEFAEEIRQLTGGRGVDVVLNSLAGEAERGRTGQPYLVLKVSCRPVDQVQPFWDGPNTVVFDRIGTEWVAVDMS